MDIAGKGVLQWLIVYEVQGEYINHLAFIPGPYMDKLPRNLIAEITDLPREFKVDVKLFDRCAPKETYATYTSTRATDTSTLDDDTPTLGKLNQMGDLDNTLSTA